MGIYAKRGAIVEVSDAIAQDTAAQGIYISENATARLTNVTVQRSGSYGIHVIRGSGVIFYGTVASNSNKVDGLAVANSSNAQFNYATVTVNSNGNHGINISNGSSLLSYSSSTTAQNNLNRGIQSFGGSAINIQTNSSFLRENNTTDGLFVGSAASLYLDAGSFNHYSFCQAIWPLCWFRRQCDINWSSLSRK